MLQIKTKRTCSQTNGQDDASEPPTKKQRQRSTSKSRIASESCKIVCVTHKGYKSGNRSQHVQYCLVVMRIWVLCEAQSWWLYSIKWFKIDPRTVVASWPVDMTYVNMDMVCVDAGLIDGPMVDSKNHEINMQKLAKAKRCAPLWLGRCLTIMGRAWPNSAQHYGYWSSCCDNIDYQNCLTASVDTVAWAKLHI